MSSTSTPAAIYKTHQMIAGWALVGLFIVDIYIVGLACVVAEVPTSAKDALQLFFVAFILIANGAGIAAYCAYRNLAEKAESAKSL